MLSLWGLACVGFHNSNNHYWGRKMQSCLLFLYCCTQISSRVNLNCGSASTPSLCLVYALIEKIKELLRSNRVMRVTSNTWIWMIFFFFSLYQLFLPRMGKAALNCSKSFTSQQALHPNHAFTAPKQSDPLPAAHRTTAKEQRTYANSLADSHWGGGKKKKKTSIFFWYAIITVKQWKILVGLLYVSD